jgi:hypothetical protein
MGHGPWTMAMAHGPWIMAMGHGGFERKNNFKVISEMFKYW